MKPDFNRPDPFPDIDDIGTDTDSFSKKRKPKDGGSTYDTFNIDGYFSDDEHDLDIFTTGVTIVLVIALIVGAIMCVSLCDCVK
jgi:ABC-type antimicrobial peptide transport system permease subunit